MKYPELPEPYLEAHEEAGCCYPETYSASQMYDYCDAGIIELDKLLDKATQEIEELKTTNLALHKLLAVGGEQIEQLLERIHNLETELYGEEL